MRLYSMLLFLMVGTMGVCQNATKGLLTSREVSSQFYYLPKVQPTITDNGNPVYYHDEYARGELCLKGKNCFQDIFFRTDLKSGVIEIKVGEGEFRYASRNQVEKYRYTDSRYSNEEFVTYFNDSGLSPSNFKMIDSISATSFLVEEITVESKRNKNSNVPGLSDSKKDVTKSKYILCRDGEYTLFKKTVPSLSREFDMDSRDLKRYIKEHSLDLKENKDLTSVVKFLLRK